MTEQRNTCDRTAEHMTTLIGNTAVLICSLATARMQIAAREIVLWTTPSEPPKALQASECSELLDPMRASCLILAQHQPGKFMECGIEAMIAFH